MPALKLYLVALAYWPEWCVTLVHLDLRGLTATVSHNPLVIVGESYVSLLIVVMFRQIQATVHCFLVHLPCSVQVALLQITLWFTSKLTETPCFLGRPVFGSSVCTRVCVSSHHPKAIELFEVGVFWSRKFRWKDLTVFYLCSHYRVLLCTRQKAYGPRPLPFVTALGAD